MPRSRLARAPNFLQGLQAALCPEPRCFFTAVPETRALGRRAGRCITRCSGHTQGSGVGAVGRGPPTRRRSAVLCAGVGGRGGTPTRAPECGVTATADRRVGAAERVRQVQGCADEPNMPMDTESMFPCPASRTALRLPVRGRPPPPLTGASRRQRRPHARTPSVARLHAVTARCCDGG